ncbi:MAG: type II secretion system minor pseudopilin GspJ [Candidatus Thiodiazotropha sp.]
MKPTANIMRDYQQRSIPYAAGFTLLELLIAITVFAIMATFAYSGLKVVLDSENQTSQYSKRMSQLQLAMNLMQRDIEQAIERPIRDQHGDEVGAFVSGGFAGTLLELTRDGHANPMKLPRSNLQRVGYQLEEETLYRLTWRILDRAQDSEPHRYKLIDDIEALELVYYDKEMKEQSQWPPERFDFDSGKKPGLPSAVEVKMELKDWGNIRRLFALVRPIPDEEQEQGQNANGNTQ